MNAIAVRSTSSLQKTQVLSGKLFDRFTAYIDGSPKTVATYTRAIRQFTCWINEQEITQPTRTDIIRYRDHLKAICKPNTVQLYIIAVRQFFKWAEQEKLYANVADNIKGAKIDRVHKKDALTTTQTKDILNSIARDTVQGQRDYAVIAIAVTGGLRTIELQRANIEDLRAVGDSTVLYIQGKGRDEKTEYVKLSTQVEKTIRSYLKARGQAAPTEPLFVSASDRNNGADLLL